MNAGNQTKDAIGIRLHPELVDALKVIAAKKKWTQSFLSAQLLRDAVIRELKKEGGFEKRIEKLKQIP